MIAQGSVLSAQGGLVEVRLPRAAIGEGIRIRSAAAEVCGVVTALRARSALVAVHGAIGGIASGDIVLRDNAALAMPLGTSLLGRCIDAQGRSLDGGAQVRARAQFVTRQAPHPGERAGITQPFWSGISAIDALLTIGRGARIGIFGAPGAGKSTLLHALMQGAHADAVVVGLVGERGREAEEWTRVAPRHAVIVCATSDRSAAERVRAAHVAMAQAAALRSRGLHVLMILDSLARYATALREIALAAGEPVGRGAYPASVFAELARYVEIAGAACGGSITLAASVLSDGDDRDPVSDSARSLLDGHIQLSNRLACSGRFPAIDVPASTSRTMDAVVSEAHAQAARVVRRALAVLAESADARALGIVPSDPDVAAAAAEEQALGRLLYQGRRAAKPAETLSRLCELADRLE
jgi:type III secretion protein N (ATPase)